uniref:Uncharacterized protein n=1 Tax=Meloidogyne enterolobii TaxID=390850 RepID=A0A6V7TW87_MELEN|nr:unnamed protein product [Meloidogyne enterolobii]
MGISGTRFTPDWNKNSQLNKVYYKDNCLYYLRWWDLVSESGGDLWYFHP